MLYSIVIHAGPSSAASYSAYRFAKAVVDSEQHQLYRIFFYHDGAYHGSQLTCSPQGERDPLQDWKHLKHRHQVELVICIAAALKRGILDKAEAERYDKHYANMAGEFTLSGLGELADATLHSERLITFGA